VDFRDPLTGASYRDPHTEMLYQAATATGSPLQYALRPPEAIGGAPMSLGEQIAALAAFMGNALPFRGGVGPLRPIRVRGTIETPGPYGALMRAWEHTLGEPMEQIRQGRLLGMSEGQGKALETERLLKEARRSAMSGDLLRPGRVRAIDPPRARDIRPEFALGLVPPGERPRAAERLIRRLMKGFTFSSAQ
jgi:hypothetical protein